MSTAMVIYSFHFILVEFIQLCQPTVHNNKQQNKTKKQKGWQVVGGLTFKANSFPVFGANLPLFAPFQISGL